MKIFFITINSLAVLLLGSFSLVSAQAVSGKIELSPKNPEPRSSVTLTISSYSFNVDTATITWRVNGGVQLSGIGEKKLTLQTGDVGTLQQVVVTAENQSGYFIEQSITVTPASVSLIYEAPKSYVPFFYEGRSFASTAGLVRVTALPSVSDGVGSLDPSSLSYTWYINGKVSKIASGRGHQSAEVRLDYLRSKTEVRVVVQTPKGSPVSKTITISPFAIQPKLYRYNEIFGTDLNAPISSRLETSKTIALKLEPYFVSNGDDKPPTYKWLLDGFDVTPVEGQILALVPKENSYGVKHLQLQIQGPDRRLQSAETSIEIIFDTR